MPNASPNLGQPNAPQMNSNAGIVRFAIFEFDVATSELRRNGILVRLQAQPAKVLAYLLAHTGRTVSREELHEAIWGTSTFVDFERGLNVCIAQIRSALGDESSAPHFIRTIPRKGYEFICPIQRAEPALPQTSPISAAAPRSRRFLISSFAAVLLIATIVASYLYARTRSHIVPTTVAVARFDNETGDPQLDHFSDTLTDDIVAQLTTNGPKNLRIIGNAAILRAPRQQRDLTRISSTLNAQFVILGQVQRIGSQTRILAHLIRLPDQSHVWVVRLDQPVDKPAALEDTASSEITAQFAAKLADPASLTALHRTVSR